MTTSKRLHNMQKNKQTQHKPRRNFAQIHKLSKPSSRFIRHKSAQWWGLDKKGVEGEEGLSKNTLRRKYKKADLIHVTSDKVHHGKALRRLVRGAMRSVKECLRMV